jgi:hypothetical protein
MVRNEIVLILEELFVDFLMHSVPQFRVGGGGYEVDHPIPVLRNHNFLGDRLRELLHWFVAEVQHTVLNLHSRYADPLIGRLIIATVLV